jgi:hypothetical protein
MQRDAAVRARAASNPSADPSLASDWSSPGWPQHFIGPGEIN